MVLWPRCRWVLSPPLIASFSVLKVLGLWLLSVPSSELYSGVGSSPFSTSKPPTIVCRARNESTQRSIKPGSSQPTVPLTPNCPLSLVRVCVCVSGRTYMSVWTWWDKMRPPDLSVAVLKADSSEHGVTSWAPAKLSNLKVGAALQH